MLLNSLLLRELKSEKEIKSWKIKNRFDILQRSKSQKIRSSLPLRLQNFLSSGRLDMIRLLILLRLL
nr:MAG TPA: hypothetical protein [Inoviridae sp.]